MHEPAEWTTDPLSRRTLTQKTLAKLLGHSEITMTQKYSHLAPGNLRLAVEKVSG